jgi:hypothetical protein
LPFLALKVKKVQEQKINLLENLSQCAKNPKAYANFRTVEEIAKKISYKMLSTKK